MGVIVAVVQNIATDVNLASGMVDFATPARVRSQPHHLCLLLECSELLGLFAFAHFLRVLGALYCGGVLLRLWKVVCSAIVSFGGANGVCAAVVAQLRRRCL